MERRMNGKKKRGCKGDWPEHCKQQLCPVVDTEDGIVNKQIVPCNFWNNQYNKLVYDKRILPAALACIYVKEEI